VKRWILCLIPLLVAVGGMAPVHANPSLEPLAKKKKLCTCPKCEAGDKCAAHKGKKCDCG
jgi:hypothetical protein